FTAVVSAIWVLAMDYLGFLLTSTVAMFLMLYRFQPKELRNAKCLMQFCLIIFGELAFMWLVFVKFLAVSLPEGQFFRMIGLA
ncbi:MAG: tripartite tricarboxylate transporter TctB family protein, partial [Mailhella sp.]|nr:tripartite tricarboxylate transporter TctB family protein [Mailhella sp.]